MHSAVDTAVDAVGFPDHRPKEDMTDMDIWIPRILRRGAVISRYCHMDANSPVVPPRKMWIEKECGVVRRLIA